MSADAPTLTRGHKKKSRTRLQLIDAARELLAERGEVFALSDVAARAGVSHGTFYNYFGDREELLDAVVAHTTEGFAALSAERVDDEDPATRFARITALALAAAAQSPERVRVTLRLEAAQRALLVDGPLAYLRDDLAAGHRTGRFTGEFDDATLDVVFGALLLAARRVVDGETSPAYRVGVIRRLLASLGVDATEANSLALQAVADTTG